MLWFKLLGNAGEQPSVSGMKNPVRVTDGNVRWNYQNLVV